MEFSFASFFIGVVVMLLIVAAIAYWGGRRGRSKP